MADIFIVKPLAADSAEELAGFGIPHPVLPTDPRAPTPRQVIVAVGGLTSFAVAVRWSPEKQRIWIDVEPSRVGNDRPNGSGTEIALSNATDDDSPCRVSFRGGSPALLAAIADRIAIACGPLVVWPASGATPFVCLGVRRHVEPCDGPDPARDAQSGNP